jgi:hypothetical protein
MDLLANLMQNQSDAAEDIVEDETTTDPKDPG